MKKAIFIVVLIFSFFTTTELAYSYFDQDTKIILDENTPMYVLEHKLSNNSKNLIPKDAILGINDAYTIEYRYVIYVEEGLTLSSEIYEIQFQNTDLESSNLNKILNAEYSYSIINQVEIDQGIFTNSTVVNQVEIVVSVSFQENLTNEDLALITNTDIQFSYLVRVTK